MSFLDVIPMKGCIVEEKDETMDDRRCRKFVVDHIHDSKKVLRKLEGVHLTLSREKSIFGQEEILVVRHLCGPYGGRLSPTKIDAIQALKEVCESEGFLVRLHSITYGLCTYSGPTLSLVAER